MLGTENTVLELVNIFNHLPHECKFHGLYHERGIRALNPLEHDWRVVEKGEPGPIDAAAKTNALSRRAFTPRVAGDTSTREWSQLKAAKAL